MSLNTPFAGIPISEVVPEAIAGMNEGLTKSSLLVSRRRIRFQPYWLGLVILNKEWLISDMRESP